jgi:hypothetical protein
MLRRTLLAAAVVLTLVATAAPVRAAPPEPSEKCDDLQNRCLHEEKGICVIWHDECLVRKPVSGHGPKRAKKGFGHKHHV